MKTNFLLPQQDPNYLNTAKAYENAGLCAQQIPDIDKATKFFMLAVKQDPNLATAWFELAQINYAEGHDQLAEQYMANYWRLNK